MTRMPGKSCDCRPYPGVAGALRAYNERVVGDLAAARSAFAKGRQQLADALGRLIRFRSLVDRMFLSSLNAFSERVHRKQRNEGSTRQDKTASFCVISGRNCEFVEVRTFHVVQAREVFPMRGPKNAMYVPYAALRPATPNPTSSLFRF